MDFTNMTAGEIIQGINRKKWTLKEVADQVGKSSKTLQTKIKSLGYRWNQNKKRCETVRGSYRTKNDSLIFIELFNSPDLMQVAKDAPEKDIKLDKKAINSVGNKAIDQILSDTPPKRVQRLYYIDPDLAAVIDSINGKQKSNLVNQCIRRVFKENGVI